MDAECRAYRCYSNTEAYVHSDGSCRVIRGWLLEDFSDFSRFIAHSVVASRFCNWSMTAPAKKSGTAKKAA